MDFEISLLTISPPAEDKKPVYTKTLQPKDNLSNSFLRNQRELFQQGRMKDLYIKDKSC